MEDIRIHLSDEAATIRLGTDLAAALRPGDFVALEGDLGSGKTTLARAMLRSLRQDPGLEVPSPTYSLLQSYEGSPPLHHLDLYRLGSPAELDELGIGELLEDGIVIAEWADRFAGDLPAPALRIRLKDGGTGGRAAAIACSSEAMPRLARSRAIRDFLARNGWGEAWRQPLAGDASARLYERLKLDGQADLLLMDAPARPDGPPVRNGLPYSAIAHLAETVTPFVAIASILRQKGFVAPEIHAADLDAGLLLIEFLDGSNFLKAGQPVEERYLEAARLLAEMHRQDWPHILTGPFGARHELPPYDRQAMLIEAELLLDWYLPAIRGTEPTDTDRRDFAQAWNAVLDAMEGGESSLVLRDYHSPNLIWLGDRQGLDRLGLIDFQDALLGPAAYDLASLAQDARVTIAPELEARMVDAYCAARAARTGHFDEAALRRDYAIMAAQRNSKILGIFVRLDRRDGKPAYLAHLPRIRTYLARAITHPALRPVRELYQRWNLIEAEGAGTRA